MNRAPVLFRVDGTSLSGRESFYRCLVFAAALQRRRRPAAFLSQLEPATYLASALRRAGNEWVGADHPAGSPEDLEQTLREVRRIRPQAVVVDAPEAGEAYLKELRASGVTVLSLDHLAATPFPSHLVINTLLGPGREKYEAARGTQLLAGPRFAIVRPEVRRVRPIRAQEPAQPFRALVALGDDDPNVQAGELARLLLNSPKVGRVDVLIRPYHPELESLKALAEANKTVLEIATEPSEFPLRISRSHMAVTSGSSWSLELACVGVPQLVIVQSEAHWPNAQRLEEEGAAVCLGWHEEVTAGTLRNSVTQLLSDPLERVGMARCGRKLIDGRGLDRLVTALELIIQTSTRTAQPFAEAA
jgi:spore coat polysaccharide biosynthesis predicted glycosyltransferase SpsG